MKKKPVLADTIAKARQVNDKFDPEAYFPALLLKLGPPAGKQTFVDRHPLWPYGVTYRSLSRSKDANAYKEMVTAELRKDFLAPARIFIEFLRWMGKEGVIDLKKNYESQGRAAPKD